MSEMILPGQQLFIPATNLNLVSGMQSTRTSTDYFLRLMVVGLNHTENLICKNLKSARKTVDLESETEKDLRDQTSEKW